ISPRAPPTADPRVEREGAPAHAEPPDAAWRDTGSSGPTAAQRTRRETTASSPPVFEHGQPENERVEDRQQREPDAEVVSGQSIDLVRDERAEEGHHPRIGPELVSQ